MGGIKALTKVMSRHQEVLSVEETFHISNFLFYSNKCCNPFDLGIASRRFIYPRIVFVYNGR